MVYQPHLVVKPQVILDAAATAIADKVVVSELVTKKSDAGKFYAAEGDTISQRVKGILPVRAYPIRNDRSKPIITDTYAETVVNVTINQEHWYSATKLTDEQKDWDFKDGWGTIVDAQTDALASKLERFTLDALKGIPYELQIKLDPTATNIANAIKVNQDYFYNKFVEAVQGLRRMRAPLTNLVALVGLNVEAELLKSNKIVFDNGRGGEALQSATLGTLAGVRLVSSMWVDPDEVLIFDKTGVVLYTGTPSVPRSVPFGTTANKNGWAMRWMMDYDSGYLTDRSVFDSYVGSTYTKDRVAVENQDGNLVQETTGNGYFLRGARITMKTGESGFEPGDGTTATDVRPGADPNSFLAKLYKRQLVDGQLPTGEWWPLGGNFPAPEVTEPPTGG